MTNFQEKVLKLINQGFTLTLIVKELECPKSSVVSIINKFGIKKEDRNYERLNTCIHNYFDTIDTEIKAYLLGFFVADGSIYKLGKSFRFGIQLHSKDQNILEIFKRELNISNSIVVSDRYPQDRHELVLLRWSSCYMGLLLIDKYRIIPNKTLDANFEFPFNNIPETLYGDFIRGFFDGDGSFEHNGKGVFTFRLVGTSKRYLSQIGDIICSRIPNTGYYIYEHIGKTINWYTFTFLTFRINKPEKILGLYKLLYSNSTFSLKRKLDKIESYLKYRGKSID